MTAPTNWPNPERPGVPMFPNITARHVLENKRRRALKLVLWDHEQDHYCTEIGYVTPQQMIGVDWEYYAPVLTPTQIAEMLAGERERVAKEIEALEDNWMGASDGNNALQDAIRIIRNLGAAP